MRCRYMISRRCSPGPTGWCPCSTPSGANRRRSSRCRSRRFPQCSWPRPIRDRVRSLVLWSPFAYFLRAPDQPFGMPESAVVDYVRGVRGIRRNRHDDESRAQLGRRSGEATLVVTLRTAGRRPGILHGDLRPVSADRRAADPREHPVADVGVAPPRRSPRGGRSRAVRRRAHSALAAGSSSMVMTTNYSPATPIACSTRSSRS